MSTPIGARRFSIDASMDIPADGFSAETDGSATFREAAEGDTIELSAGYDDAGTPVVVEQITGLVNEWQLNVGTNVMSSVVSGRDKIGELLDRPFRKIFLRAPLGGQPLRILGIAVEPPPPVVEPDVPFAIGTFLASEIAREIITAAGLTLAWQCRDYELLTNFDASGRSLDLLRQLVDPWSQTERFKVDIFAQGNVIICRDRVASPTADYSFSVLDARILGLSVRKRQLLKFGTVKLLGKLVPPGLFLGAVGFSSSEEEETQTVKTFDQAGRVITTVVTVTTFRQPDHVPIRKIATTFDAGGIITQLQTTDYVWEDAIYNESGAINQPRQLLEFTKRESVLEEDPGKLFRETFREEKSWGYDDLQFLAIETTKKFEFVSQGLASNGALQGSLDQTEQIVETLRDLDHLQVERVRDVYERSATTGSLFLKTSDTTISAGLRPGGIRPPRTAGSAPNAGGVPLELEQEISTDVRAVDVTFSNPNMDEDDLTFIMSHFQQSSGIYEYELSLELASMPWVRKGHILHITGLLAEDGTTPILLDPALIFDQRLSFDESSNAPRMVSSIRAVFWKAT